MQGRRRPDERSVTVLGVVATTSVIQPAFLTGAVAVQIRAGIGLTESQIGLAIGVFFVGSALGSAPMGRLAERIGGRAAIAAGAAAVAVCNLVVAGYVNDAVGLYGTLAVAGLGNSLAQPGVNLLLVERVAVERLGFATALKQSGMPTAALLGGAAVPAVALTLGWRACFLLAAVLASVTVALVGWARAPRFGPAAGRPTSSAPGGVSSQRRRARPDLPLRVLLVMATVGVFGGGAEKVVVGYLVSAAVDAGVEPGPAGLLLTMGAAIGVTSRLTHGWLADRGRLHPLRRVMTMFAVGAVAVSGLSVHAAPTYLVATPFVFAAGWAWPGLFNLVVLNANRSAPAAATGVTQAGVYTGSVGSPIAAGFMIEWAGYPTAWWFAAVLLAGAGVTTWWVGRLLAAPGTFDRDGTGGIELGGST